MTWTTRDKIFEVLRDKKLSTKEIIGGLESIGDNDSYPVVTNYLRKITSNKQLNRERIGKEYFYYNPRMYKEKLK
jgi:hypothetical protein